ncbi:MAG: hypothetical protein NWF03_09105, partial [Candidatus Bathyarchaeota archaeon]|nr:hypothetical protein [Candidatus Bathyarchaeota archaeon]
MIRLMRLDSKLLVLVCLTICTLLVNIPPAVAQDTEYELQLTYIEVYRDGVVRVTQMMAVNETYPVVTVPLFGSSANNFIILDENLTVLDYELVGNTINVYTLGTTGFSVQYETSALTVKEFDVWSLVLDTPVNVTVILPEDSTIIDLNKVPTTIDTMGNKIMLELFADQWVISYTFPL